LAESDALNTTDKVSKIVIVGGGTAGWMAAAALSELLKKKNCAITLVESEQIGTVGVGEATLPHLRFFNQRLGIAEPEFMQATNATYKLGIEFINWGQRGDAYVHPFGEFGRSINGVPFHHYWLKSHQQGNAHPIGDYSLPVVVAKQNRFAYPAADLNSLSSTYSYAYHIDASLYARYLRQYSEQRGVVRSEGKVASVVQHPESGFIEAVIMESGESIEGDLFIDCSGFRGLLIEQTLQSGYEHWNQWLPCDRAVAIPCASVEAPIPYTRATADSAGWRWRIPLQHRVGNGHVYSSSFTTDEEALRALQGGLEGEAHAEPNFLRFNTGRRKAMWDKNCVAIGLSGGFLEPLESTGIHLIQLAIMKLIEFFPNKAMEPAYRDEFNRVMRMEIERIKDFLILHYRATQRDDTEFWKYCRNMTLPEELQRKIDLFLDTGYVVRYEEGLFLEPSWVAVYFGQRMLPRKYDSRVDLPAAEALDGELEKFREAIRRHAEAMPLHSEALAGLSGSTDEGWKHASMNLYNAQGASH
jgi:tryptophan 7-halogenase